MDEMEQYVEVPSDENISINVCGAHLGWPIVLDNPETNNIQEVDEKQDLMRTEKQVSVSLRDLTFTIEKGELIGICGSVGCGKTSLLLGLLSQMLLLEGKVQVSGSLAYVGQQAWILNSSLRENITLGEPYEQDRYDEVLEVCSLKPDVAGLPAGDLTEIGEKGINISGGQKQRISMARALYFNKNNYLLDDPMSALDPDVAKGIFDKVIKGFLKNKTVLLVTHNLEDASKCDRIFFIKKKIIAEIGTHAELMRNEDTYAMLFQAHTKKREKTAASHKEELAHMIKKVSPITSVSLNGSQQGALMTKEEKLKGTIPAWVFHDYIKYAGGYLVAIPVVMTFVMNVGALSFSSWWLSYWLNAGSGNTTSVVGNVTTISDSVSDNPELSYYTLIYSLTIFFILSSSLVRGFAFMKATIRASSKMHDDVFVKVFSCPMRFFDTTPVGRTLNLFSRDLDEADVGLPRCMETFLQNVWVVFASLLFVCCIFPYFLLLLIPIGFVFMFLRNIFRDGIRDLKRKDNVSRSPLYTHIATSMSGLSSLQAYKKKKLFYQLFLNLFDENSQNIYLFNCAVRWLSIRLDILAVLVSTVTAAFAILSRGVMSAAYAGLALSYAGQLSGLFQYTVRLSVETEAKFTSVQRIINYIKGLVPEDATQEVFVDVDANWPEDGRIGFRDVWMQYRPTTPWVLKGITFEVQAGEKIGVVGRTGGGKSSVGVALFRLVELAKGAIVVDGIDIKTIPLKTLRSKLSVIPQDPVLFIGTIRYNLDPFNEFCDEQIWMALEETYLKAHICALPSKLLAPVIENGENFSVGERQLLCMTRALLRNSKIIFLDEATAGIDADTDLKIQKTLLKAFSHCTTITVAHRVETLRNCHRIVVMEDGCVVKYVTPKELGFL